MMLGDNNDNWWLDDPACDYTQANQKILQNRHQTNQRVQEAFSQSRFSGGDGVRGWPETVSTTTKTMEEVSRSTTSLSGNVNSTYRQFEASTMRRTIDTPTEENEVVVRLGVRDAPQVAGVSSATRSNSGVHPPGTSYPSTAAAIAGSGPYNNVQPLRSSPFFEYANDPLPGVYGTLQRDPSVGACPRFLSQDTLDLKDPEALAQTLQRIQSYYGYHPIMSEALRVLDRLSEPVELKSECEKSSGIRQRRTTLAKNETTIRWPSEYSGEGAVFARPNVPDTPVPIPLPLEDAQSSSLSPNAAEAPRFLAEIAAECLGPRKPHFLVEAAEIVQQQQQQPHFHSLLFPPPRVLRAFEEDNNKRPPPMPVPVEAPMTKSVFAAASELLAAVPAPRESEQLPVTDTAARVGASSSTTGQQPETVHAPYVAPLPAQANGAGAFLGEASQQLFNRGDVVATTPPGGTPPPPPPPAPDALPSAVVAACPVAADAVTLVEDEYEARRRRALVALKRLFDPTVAASDAPDATAAASPQTVDLNTRAPEHTASVAVATPLDGPIATPAPPAPVDEYEVRRLAAVERLKVMMRLPNAASPLGGVADPSTVSSLMRPSSLAMTSTGPSPSPSPHQPTRY